MRARVGQIFYREYIFWVFLYCHRLTDYNTSPPNTSPRNTSPPNTSHYEYYTLFTIPSAALSYALSMIATGSADRTVRVWDFETGKLDGHINDHDGDITAMTILDPYPLLLVSDSAGFLKV